MSTKVPFKVLWHFPQKVQHDVHQCAWEQKKSTMSWLAKECQQELSFSACACLLFFSPYTVILFLANINLLGVTALPNLQGTQGVEQCWRLLKSTGTSCQIGLCSLKHLDFSNQAFTKFYDLSRRFSIPNHHRYNIKMWPIEPNKE